MAMVIQYDDTYKEQDVLDAWDMMMKRYGRKWNIFALDIKNEPHGIATWVSQNDIDNNLQKEYMLK